MWAERIAEAIRAQATHQETLLAKTNVVGVAVGFKESQGVLTDEIAVVTLVEEKFPLAALPSDQVIPKALDGVRTDVVEIGHVTALQGPRDRFRPTIPNGVSIGHYKVTAGTLGIMVRDRATGEKFLLSNNHVFANNNDALVGDAILQPGAMDGGRSPSDVVAHLERFIALNYLEGPITPPSKTPIPVDDRPKTSGCDIADAIILIANAISRFLGSGKRVQAVPQTSGASAQALENAADCALARPLDATMFSDEIRGIGQVSGTKPVALGMRVRKTGRTTDYTEGAVTMLNATVNVAYTTPQGARTGRFSGQVITQGMSQGGDSGALVVDLVENTAVGLLFAGSNVASIFTPIDKVLALLNVTL